MKISKFFAILAVGAMFVSCAKASLDGIYGGATGSYDPAGEASPDGDGDEGSEGNGNTQAGKITAGEWNDLDNWPFWSDLMRDQEEESNYAQYSGYWYFYTQNRVAVKVENPSGAPVAGIKVDLKLDGEICWKAVTDNLGRAELWASLYAPKTLTEDNKVEILVNGVLQQEAPVVTKWNSEELSLNKYIVEGAGISAKNVDIAFFVDATGSMYDEISFLKSDLLDIIQKVQARQSGASIRLGALFYRDEGDDYVTKSKNFSSDFKTISNFVNTQKADGGGDYPEAVHTALEKGLQDLSWDENARTRLVFMILDAPAHNNDNVKASLQTQIQRYAAAGIKIIPVAASGVDKATEFMLRFFAVATNGTYTFITNDSGIGNDHIAPSVGQYKVEQLNELIVRLIDKYIE